VKTGGRICCGAAHFPRNLAPDFLQYMVERPEVTSHEGKPKKAKQECKREPTKEERKK
jgi:hypothetical protein